MLKIILPFLLIGLVLDVYPYNLLCDPQINWVWSGSYRFNHTACTLTAAYSPDDLPGALMDVSPIFSDPSRYPLNFTIHGTSIPYAATVSFGIMFKISYTGFTGSWHSVEETDTANTITYEWISSESTNYKEYSGGTYIGIGDMAPDQASTITDIGFNVESINLNQAKQIVFDFASLSAIHTPYITDTTSVPSINPTQTTTTHTPTTHTSTHTPTTHHTINPTLNPITTIITTKNLTVYPTGTLSASTITKSDLNLYSSTSVSMTEKSAFRAIHLSLGLQIGIILSILCFCCICIGVFFVGYFAREYQEKKMSQSDAIINIAPPVRADPSQQSVQLSEVKTETKGKRDSIEDLYDPTNVDPNALTKIAPANHEIHVKYPVVHIHVPDAYDGDMKAERIGELTPYEKKKNGELTPYDVENVVNKNEEMTEVQSWLNMFQSSQYLSNFIENGYDTMDIIVEITDISYLEEIGIVSLEDQTKIISEIKKLQHIELEYNEKGTNHGDVAIYYDAQIGKMSLR